MRKWLNSTGGSEEDPGFLQTAFTEQERAVIRYREIETIVNSDILKTRDSVFLLSAQDSVNAGYGFWTKDKESKNRVAESTAYAAGKQQTEENQWWLRTHTRVSSTEMAARVLVKPDGIVDGAGLKTTPFTGFARHCT